jgi:DNA-directed RNA polymerase subunit RPC12/RpoP
MAEGRLFVCSGCGTSVSAWSDGNPYYRLPGGGKQYAYHPSHERSRCTGNDEEAYCLACGHEFKSDSAKPARRCRKCKSEEIIPAFQLSGCKCPKCTTGVFVHDPSHNAIS